ncbi:MAG: 2-octaprenyl-6-methoxyphenyl hydroxylase, partial [Gammaproteobacteria bacterium]|nr:2-octaprenyl-6-methoxyphenyl hydroxylase [Gammaproteobacteria bacterium]MCI0590485.1 2-octaprenyl-6-methoxyphenyl hydroxylase [Gammaproteobacteria bacterium]
MPRDYDVLVIGGGMVGATLTCALADQPLRIGIVEAVPFQDKDQPSYDDRGLALALASQRVLAGLGLWDRVSQEANPIRHVHVSDRGQFGFVRMDAATVGVDALGYVVLARTLGKILTERFTALDNVEVFCPARLQGIRVYESRAEVSVRLDRESVKLTTRLLVGADGTASEVRRLLRLTARKRDYGQTAIVANVTPQRPRHNTAFERFTDTGPLALLPLSETRAALVWTLQRGAVDGVMAMDEQSFLGGLEGQFGRRLGRFYRLGQRKSYPLCRLEAKQQVLPRVVMLGNAAHTVHPNAAQGLNLGLRDVAALAEVICDAIRDGQDPGAEPCLKRYLASRRTDQQWVISFTDGLAGLFYNDDLFRMLVRDIGMLGLDLIPPFKRRFMRQVMGLVGRQPRLVRGLAL